MTGICNGTHKCIDKRAPLQSSLIIKEKIEADIIKREIKKRKIEKKKTKQKYKLYMYY